MEFGFWSLLPALIAIGFALITKEVNLSLLVGILVGAAIYSHGNPFNTITLTTGVMAEKAYENFGVLIFIVLLGMVVYLMNLSGATSEYAQWAKKHLKTGKQTLLFTMLLGIIIFVDDYFNCLTVGTVMRPVTDEHRISREKLAYIIDSTAAPICIIAPVSSWAAAVSTSLPDGSSIDGFQLFLSTIFSNYYSWLSLLMILLTTLFCVDFGKMKVYEQEARVNGIEETDLDRKQDFSVKGNGKTIDLILPVLALILFAFAGMLYTGGFFHGVSFAEAFAGCDAITGLVIGTFATVIFIALLYLPRQVITPKQFLDGLPAGFKQMCTIILILLFAWTLSGICGREYLNTGGYMAMIVERYNIPMAMMPACFFLIALVLAFATGTSWGTFPILLPITLAVFGDTLTPIMSITTAAILGGSVCGDHISPISDTTILSSAGADCHHINHVSSQMQYAAVVAVITVICYVVAGVT